MEEGSFEKTAGRDRQATQCESKLMQHHKQSIDLLSLTFIILIQLKLQEEEAATKTRRLQAVAQEKRDFELALRLAQVSNVLQNSYQRASVSNYTPIEWIN